MNLSTAQDIVYNGNTVNGVYLGQQLIWPSNPYESQYFTFEVVGSQGSYFQFHPEENINYSMEYSLDDGVTWNNMPEQGYAPWLTTGEKMICRGTLTNSNNTSIYGIGQFFIAGTCKVYGNIMSLIYGDNFVGKYDLTDKNCGFSYLFKESSTIIDAENLVLPARILTDSCYFGLFFECYNLVTPPTILPAKTLPDYCYQQMFDGCKNLTTAPIISALTLGVYCCDRMFYRCISLTATPILQATTLGLASYHHMFFGCTSLNNVTCLATDISASLCTYNWLYNVAATGTFTKAAGMTGWTTGVDGIPSGWTTQNYNG